MVEVLDGNKIKLDLKNLYERKIWSFTDGSYIKKEDDNYALCRADGTLAARDGEECVVLSIDNSVYFSNRLILDNGVKLDGIIREMYSPELFRDVKTYGRLLFQDNEQRVEIYEYHYRYSGKQWLVSYEDDDSPILREYFGKVDELKKGRMEQKEGDIFERET